MKSLWAGSFCQKMLFVALFAFQSHSLASNLNCKDIFLKRIDSIKIDYQGYSPEAQKINFSEEHTLDIPHYIFRNLGSQADALSVRYDQFLILVGEPKDYNQTLRAEGITVLKTINKSYGTHHLSEGIDKKGRLVLLVSNLHVGEQVLRSQLLLKAAKIPGAKVKTFGSLRSLKDVYLKTFQQMGAPPDIVVYGFAGTFLYEMLRLNPRISLSRLKFNLAMQKKKRLSSWNSNWTEPFYSVTLADGTRIWLLTNVYGENAKFLFEAVSEKYNPQLFLALGTAGAVNPAVDRGHFFSPDHIIKEDGSLLEHNLSPLTSFALSGTYSRVQTPLVETQSWLDKNKDLGVDVVDVELGHIIEAHQENPHIPLKAAFLISDQILLNNQVSDLSKWNKQTLSDSSSALFAFLKSETGRTSDESWKIQSVSAHYKKQGEQ